MRAFSDLGVQLTRRFDGDRIRIEKVEGDEIVVLDYEIRQSKLKRENDPNWDGARGECVYIQIQHNGQRRVMWGNYKFLIDQLRQIPVEALPFTATIVNEHGYVFK